MQQAIFLRNRMISFYIQIPAKPTYTFKVIWLAKNSLYIQWMENSYNPASLAQIGKSLYKRSLKETTFSEVKRMEKGYRKYFLSNKEIHLISHFTTRNLPQQNSAFRL